MVWSVVSEHLNKGGYAVRCVETGAKMQGALLVEYPCNSELREKYLSIGERVEVSCQSLYPCSVSAGDHAVMKCWMSVFTKSFSDATLVRCLYPI